MKYTISMKLNVAAVYNTEDLKEQYKNKTFEEIKEIILKEKERIEEDIKNLLRQDKVDLLDIEIQKES
jgi:CRISPR/Cas system CSM-associated protein Csm2 small subunit